MEMYQGESSSSRIPPSTVNHLAERDQRTVLEQVKISPWPQCCLLPGFFMCFLPFLPPPSSPWFIKKIAMDIWIYRSLCPWPERRQLLHVLERNLSTTKLFLTVNK
jgi:hypothetical protein